MTALTTKTLAALAAATAALALWGGWKLMQNDPFSPLELYDLESDPLEQTDLSGSRRDIVRDLSEALRRQLQAGGRVPWQGR